MLLARHWFPSYFRSLAMLVLAVASVLSAQSASAQVTVSDTKLTFAAGESGASQRSFTVKGNPLPALAIVRHDLLDAKTGRVILNGLIEVSSTRDQASNQELFTVTVKSTSAAGTYVGDLDVMDASKTPSVRLISVQLEVTGGVPSVEAELNSKSLTLKVKQPFFDIPFFGQPSAVSDSEKQYERAVFLVQTGDIQAVVRSASVLAMKGTNDEGLPEGVLNVAQTFPLSIPVGNSAAVKLKAGGNNIGAGEYNGSLHVWIADVKAPIQIPIKLLVKDGPLVAFVVLLFGLMSAALFGWWAAKGQGVREIIKGLDRLAATIKSGEKLQLAEKGEATRFVKETMESVETAEAGTEIRKKFDAAEAYIRNAIATVDKFIAEELEPLRAKTNNVLRAKKIRDGFLESLDQVKANLLAGRYPSFATAEQVLSDPHSGLTRRINYFESIVNFFNNVPEANKEEVAKKMDEASTAADLIAILKTVNVEVPPQAGLSFAAAEEEATAGQPPIIELSLKRSLILSIGAASVAVIAFLFVLAVGWISIYVRSDVFGANPMDYITIFLWGATAEAVRGQTISLTGLKTVVQEKPPPP